MRCSKFFLVIFIGLPTLCWADAVTISTPVAVAISSGSSVASSIQTSTSPVDPNSIGKPPEDPPLTADELKRVDYVLHHKGEAGWESEVKALTFRQKKFVDLYPRVDEQIEAGHYTEAIANLQKIVRSDSGDTDAHAKLTRLLTVSRFLGPEPDLHQKGADVIKQGISLYVAGDTVAALYRMAYSLSLNPVPPNRDLFNYLSTTSGRTVEVDWNSPLDSVEQKLSAALLAFRAGDYMKAVALSREALLMDPNNILAYKRMGSSLYAVGDYDKAINAWSQCLVIDPNDPGREKINSLIAHAKEKSGRMDHEIR